MKSGIVANEVAWVAIQGNDWTLAAPDSWSETDFDDDEWGLHNKFRRALTLLNYQRENSKYELKDSECDEQRLLLNIYFWLSKAGIWAESWAEQT